MVSSVEDVDFSGSDDDGGGIIGESDKSEEKCDVVRTVRMDVETERVGDTVVVSSEVEFNAD